MFSGLGNINKKKKQKKTRSKNFVSEYAMTNSYEDTAETLNYFVIWITNTLTP